MKNRKTLMVVWMMLLATHFACSKTPDTAPPAPPVPPSNTPPYAWTTFVMGSDLSYVNITESAGGVYKEKGVVKDVFGILKSHGNNLVRVRLWHNPSWQQSLNGGKFYSNLADVEKTIQRAKAQGMAVNLDLHYSDRWADPDHQEIPAAWKGLPLSTLSDSVYQYTLSTLQYLATKNLVPEMIQVGNENNSGMLWPIGHTNAGWAPFAQLLKAGIKAVRDFSKTSTIKPRIILHVAQFQNAGYWSDNLAAAGVTDYDVLGISHYYKWSNVNNFEGIASAIAQLKSKTGKAVMVVETAFPFTNTNADSYNNIFWEASGAALGFPFSIEGQKNYYTALTQAIVKGGGSGIMVWEPAWISSTLNDGWGIGSSWENNSFFDYSGNLHDGISFMMQRYTGL